MTDRFPPTRKSSFPIIFPLLTVYGGNVSLWQYFYAKVLFVVVFFLFL